jgi:hypothetical protein
LCKDIPNYLINLINLLLFSVAAIQKLHPKKEKKRKKKKTLLEISTPIIFILDTRLVFASSDGQKKSTNYTTCKKVTDSSWY